MGYEVLLASIIEYTSGYLVFNWQLWVKWKLGDHMVFSWVRIMRCGSIVLWFGKGTLSSCDGVEGSMEGSSNS